MWIVTKEDYDMCKVNKSAGRRILSCDSPLKLKYYQMVFRAYSPPRLDESVDIRLEFAPGTKYYFIGRASSRLSVDFFQPTDLPTTIKPATKPTLIL